MQTVDGQTDLEIRGSVAVRRWIAPTACVSNLGHEHNYDHWTRCTKGSIHIERINGDGSRTFLAELGRTDAAVLIAAGVRHVIKPLEDNTEYECEYLHRDGQGTVVEVYQCGVVDNARCYR